MMNSGGYLLRRRRFAQRQRYSNRRSFVLSRMTKEEYISFFAPPLATDGVAKTNASSEHRSHDNGGEELSNCTSNMRSSVDHMEGDECGDNGCPPRARVGVYQPTKEELKAFFTRPSELNSFVKTNASSEHQSHDNGGEELSNCMSNMRSSVDHMEDD